MKQNKKKGFTLLEIIIVIIIIGVMASLALPRFFQMVEYSRSAEALTNLGTLRGSMERCYLQTNNYTLCPALTDLDVGDPGQTAGTHFTYAISGTTATGGFTITATRNTTDGGSTGSTIALGQNNATGAVTYTGQGAFQGIK